MRRRVRVVFWSVSVSVKAHLTSGASLPEKTVSRQQRSKNCRVFFHTALLQRSSTPSVDIPSAISHVHILALVGASLSEPHLGP